MAADAAKFCAYNNARDFATDPYILVARLQAPNLVADAAIFDNLKFPSYQCVSLFGVTRRNCIYIYIYV